LGFRIEIETQVVKHFGAEDYWESATAAMLRTPEIPLPSNTSFNFAIGNGLSYAFTAPAYEWGTTGKRGIDTTKLLDFLAVEAQFSAADRPDFHLVFMLHHRCGVWGLIGPASAGSNYFGAGLRADLY
jgi:hypothetical protein